MIEKHLQNQIQRCSAKQDNESAITPEHCTIERYFEKNSLHECLQKKKMSRKHPGAHFNDANEQNE